MYVLMDIEWVQHENEMQWPTQIVMNKVYIIISYIGRLATEVSQWV